MKRLREDAVRDIELKEEGSDVGVEEQQREGNP